MKSKDQTLLEEAYQRVLEQKQDSPKELFKRFSEEVLANYSYKTNGKGHLNCSWAAMAMCKWGEKKGYNMKAIYFVWPTKETTKQLKDSGVIPPYYEDEGMSHIAPVYADVIIDFTFGQFNPNKTILYTPLQNWKSVYGQYGYGTNDWPKGSRKFVYVDTFDNLLNNKELGINPISPSRKT